jgi:hypothetical protein
MQDTDTLIAGSFNNQAKRSMNGLIELTTRLDSIEKRQ